MTYAVSVEVSGPLFAGLADEEVWDYCERAVQEIASQGYSEVMTRLDASIRHPTPYYETQIRVREIAGGFGKVIDDSGIIYGPWLEGIGSMNSPKTRFPGYFSFRRATWALEEKGHDLAEHVLPPYLERMN